MSGQLFKTQDSCSMSGINGRLNPKLNEVCERMKKLNQDQIGWIIARNDRYWKITYERIEKMEIQILNCLRKQCFLEW